MSYYQKFLTLSLIILLGTSLVPGRVQAARGIPPSQEFAYGIRINLEGENIKDTLDLAASLRVDWIAIDLDWAAIWPDPSQQPRLDALDLAMNLTNRYDIAVQISLINPPNWARKNQAPDPDLASWFIVNLVKRYPNCLKVIELLPGANSHQVWGAQPNAKAYLQLIRITNKALKDASINGIIIMPGLVTLPVNQPAKDDIDDLTFLQQLYQAGAAQMMPALSISFLDLTGSPSNIAGSPERRFLRHYEDIHQIMLTNNHIDGTLWVSRFSFPTGKIEAKEMSVYKDANAQNQWLVQAYKQMRSQLYIGAAIYNSLDITSENSNSPECYSNLAHPDSSGHLFCLAFKSLINQNRKLAHLDFSNPQEKHITKVRTDSP
jgi:hypothetical protein